MMKKTLQHLKQSREKAGFTQKEVEKALDLRNLTIRDYESGRLKLPISIALELADLYHVNVDELVGNTTHLKQTMRSKELAQFHTLFTGNRFGLMLLDPILRAFVEDHHEKFFDHSLFELMTESLHEKHKKELVVEIGKFLFSLAGTDGKISDLEIDCIKSLLFEFEMQKEYKNFTTLVETPYLPLSISTALHKIEIRHFIIWIMFFFALADNYVSYEEIAYIEKCAQNLKINKSNFLFIKEKFNAGGI